MERARGPVLAAAYAAITKRAYFATRTPTKATDYLSRVRMGQTDWGSCVLTIRSDGKPLYERPRTVTVCIGGRMVVPAIPTSRLGTLGRTSFIEDPSNGESREDEQSNGL